MTYSVFGKPILLSFHFIKIIKSAKLHLTIINPKIGFNSVFSREYKRDMSLAQNFLSSKEQKKVVLAIKEAEKDCSGEIRVHIEDTCKEDLLDHAAFVFEKLEIHKTELRNGVLFYVSVKPHGFAILGDVGINQKVDDNFWDETKDHVITNFKKGEFGKGLSEGIIMAGTQLKKYFPYQTDDVNELSDEISFGN